MKENKKMSFALTVKNEIFCNKTFKGKHKTAYGYGLIMYSKSYTEDNMHISTENKGIARLYGNILYDLIPIKGTVTTNEVRYNNLSTVYTSSIDEKEDRLSVLKIFGNDEKLYINSEIVAYEGDAGAFLAGAFLACGNINDPIKGYHLEFVTSTEHHAEILSKFLGNLDIKHGMTERRSYKVIYIKESEQIEDILTLMGATKSAFELMNVKIYKGLRNNANRVTNCETANIDKTVNAASLQMDAINKIDGFLGLDTLAPDLREIVEIRIENPDISLREIGELTHPILSRSAVNHRIQKILAIAQNLG